MDRTGKIVIALAIAGLLAWTVVNQRNLEKIKAARQAAAAEIQLRKAAETPTPLETPAAVPVANVPPAIPTVPAQTETLANPAVEFTFTSLGGGIARAVLLHHEAESGKRMVINEFGPTPIGAVTEAADGAATVPFAVTREADGRSITFQRIDDRQLEVTKKFQIAQPGDGADEYTARLDVTFANRGNQPLAIPAYYVHAGAAAPVHQRDLPTYTGFKYSTGKFHDVSWFSASGFLGMGHGERPVFSEAGTDIAWLGVANQYFTTLLSPQTDAVDEKAKTSQRGAAVWARRFDVAERDWTESGRDKGNGAVRHAVQAALGMPALTLAPGQSATQRFLIYTGPREFSRLKPLGSTEEQMMDFGMFGIVSKTLLNGLNLLHAWLGNYAGAIVVLTLVIKSLLWPMQNKATQSMKRMSLLQPKMAEIKEKYGDDPTRMNTETLKLYKDYGVNPVSGCLPMFIQIPIFFGFYNMLGKAVELRNSHFLWIKDLSQPDTLTHLAGFPVNVLPLVMAGTMFWQMAISPKSGDQMQQRMFMFMPLIFVSFCYNYASALALYWTVQNLFSVAQLYATRNQAPPELRKLSAPKKK
jgi:YidC/Oxa1 family membrane protein insertase